MRNQHMAGIRCRDDVPDQPAVAVTDVQAILSHQRADLEIEGHVHRVQNLADLGFADLVVTLVIEIDLVDGSASGND